MHFLSTFLFVGAVSAAAHRVLERSAAYLALEGVMEGILKRQVRICKAVEPPVTCERSCGPGFVECTRPDMCYNPGRGDICCSNGYYCKAGTYCTDNGCCPDGNSLEECNATRTVSIIPPPATKEPNKEPTGMPNTKTTKEPITETTVKPILPTRTPTVVPGGTTTTPVAPPPVVTAGAGKNAELGALAALGGLGALMMAI
ncbi:hypothetical protein FZEAL_8493 [Fusarium zealandicum]|uniref:Uncharacterized protein n=1 Tax=Fusarium zealandicum TaxID=1053134 RepID=A0A8H4XHL7_9HYPO|nr:hypothetical protein FZEAL_8493 [Fusarium zealandicum]